MRTKSEKGQTYYVIISFLYPLLHSAYRAFAQLSVSSSCFKLQPLPFISRGRRGVRLQSIQGHVRSHVYNGDGYSPLQCAAL